MAVLSDDQVTKRLEAVQGWKLAGGEIEKEYRFRDFANAMAFVNGVATAAEEADHHPDITITYNRVKLRLSTHSEGGLTDKDFSLAQQIDSIA